MMRQVNNEVSHPFSREIAEELIKVDSAKPNQVDKLITHKDKKLIDYIKSLGIAVNPNGNMPESVRDSRIMVSESELNQYADFNF